MIWFAIILALVIATLVALYTRNIKQALVIGFMVLVAGVILSLIIVYSGIMGG